MPHMSTGEPNYTEAEYAELLDEYAAAVDKYGSTVKVLMAAKSSPTAKGSQEFNSAMDAANATHERCKELHRRLVAARKKAEVPESS